MLLTNSRNRQAFIEARGPDLLHQHLHLLQESRPSSKPPDSPTSGMIGSLRLWGATCQVILSFSCHPLFWRSVNRHLTEKGGLISAFSQNFHIFFAIFLMASDIDPPCRQAEMLTVASLWVVLWNGLLSAPGCKADSEHSGDARSSPSASQVNLSNTLPQSQMHLLIPRACAQTDLKERERVCVCVFLTTFFQSNAVGLVK